MDRMYNKNELQNDFFYTCHGAVFYFNTLLYAVWCLLFSFFELHARVIMNKLFYQQLPAEHVYACVFSIK